ncbi:HNH endonuclease [uncultured Acinetobacter sp.]|uniref:HNH endonuclease n=1 Tax=uncultured Acinetobacter sp. TaxID=165433 RepID=UPI003747978A
MSICYLCGLRLVSLKGLKLNNNEKKEKIVDLKRNGECVKHEEHIIPNALGGYLKSDNVLCEECGSKLNDAVDHKFIENFDFLKKLLNLRVDRSSNKNNQTKAKFYLSKFKIVLDVMWSNEKIECYGVNHHIEHEEEKIYFFGKKQRAEKYLKEKKIDSLNYELIISEFVELQDENFIFPNFNIENLNFKQELAKISAGFATKLGVDRKFLNRVIDFENKSILDKLCIYPFYPFTELDVEIEKIKQECYEHPHHFLSLFTLQFENKEEKLIFCYVELFSTFQYYVLLSDNYTEESIYHVYAQPVLFKEFEEIELDYKQGNYYFELLKCNGYDCLTWEKFNQMTYEEQKRKVNHVMEITRYDFYYEDYLDKIFTPITNKFIFNNNKDDKSLDLAFNIKDIYQTEYDRDGDIVSESVDLKKYRITYIDGFSNRERKFYALESCKFLKDKNFITRLEKYNHEKFFQLLNFIKNQMNKENPS